MPRKPDKVKNRKPSSSVPPEWAYAFRYGKRAYLEHPGYAEPTEEAFNVYMACGVMIHRPEKARELWQYYREALLKRPGVQSWWAFEQYEKHE